MLCMHIAILAQGGESLVGAMVMCFLSLSLCHLATFLKVFLVRKHERSLHEGKLL